MRSESTSALGQPSETKPTFGAVPRRLGLAAVFIAVFILGRGRSCGWARAVCAVARRREWVVGGEVRKREVAEQITGLLLHLLLHLQEGVGALLEVAAHQTLNCGPLHFQEFAPGV